MDQKFQQILAWQQLDQNKAVSQILQQVGKGANCLGGGSWESNCMQKQDREWITGAQEQQWLGCVQKLFYLILRDKL